MMDHEVFDRKLRSGISVFIFCLCGFSASAIRPCCGQPAEIQTQNQASAETVTNELIDAALQELEAAKDIDDATKGSIQQLYQQAKQRLKEAETSVANAAAYDNMVQIAPADLNEANRLLARPAEPAKPVSPTLSYDELQQRIITQRAEVETAKELVGKLADEPARRQTRMAELPNLIGEAKKELEDVVAQLAQPAPATEKPLQTRARLMQLRARKIQLEQQINELNKEQAAYSATTDLLPLQQKKAAREVAESQAKLEELQKAIAARREYDVQQFLKKSLQAVESAPAELKAIAQENLDLANQFKTTSDEIGTATSELNRVRTNADELEADQKTAQSRIDAVGLTDTLGIMLRQKKTELVRQRNQLRPDSNASEAVQQIQVEIFRLEDLAAALADLPGEASRALKEQGVPANHPQHEALESAATALLKDRQQLLAKLIKTQNDLFQTRIALNTAKHNYVRDANRFTTFIDKHVLWIRSAPPIMLSDLPTSATAFSWLTSPKNWRQAGQDLLAQFLQTPIIYLLVSSGLLLLFVFRLRFRRIIKEAGQSAERRGCSDIMPTVNSLFATLFVAIAWPAVALVIGWALVSRPQAADFARAVGHGFISVALFVAPLELLRQVWRDKGLATSHFGWGSSLSSFFRRHFRWFFPVATVALFVMVVMQHQEHETWRNSLGRFSAIVLFGATVLFLRVLLKPDGVVFQRVVAANGDSRLYRFRRLAHLVGIAVPLSLGVVSIVGYHYTAYKLWGCLEETAALVIALLIVTGFVTRWLLTYKRRLLRAEARTRLEAYKAEQGKKSGETTKNAAELAGIEVTGEPEVKLSSISEQAREIVSFLILATVFVGCWWIWREVLPAIGILDGINLWSVSIGERVEQVTMADVTYALLVAVATFLSIKNMPGLLELVVLRHSALDSGARYAVTTIFRYIITVIGLTIALGFLSVPWSQYSWLVGAIMVGLGFGLQEIVANFVSGIILLLERPVRVGDVVTIDGTTGVVSRIQMRATTVTNWDRQELIVPNKNLITGQLLNWSLSNVINRLVINVGVAYGTDTNLVYSLLEKAVQANPKVLADPAPLINFEEFGDSSLNFVVRCYLSGLEHRVNVTHQLHTAINEAFNEAGISIPFPQRDVHLFPTPADGIADPTPADGIADPTKSS